MAKNYIEPNKAPERYQEQAGTGSAIPTTFPVYEGFVHSNKDFSKTGRIKVRIPALQSYQRSLDTKGKEATESMLKEWVNNKSHSKQTQNNYGTIPQIKFN